MSLPSDLTLYAVLNVDRSATEEEIKTAFYRAASQNHPDRGGDHDIMAKINLAYTVLTNDKARKRYDNELDMLGEICPTCSGAGRLFKQRGFTKREARVCETCNGNGILRWKRRKADTVIASAGPSRRRR